MKENKQTLSSKKISSIADYITTYKKIEREIQNKKIKSNLSLKIAILSSFTIKGLKETLFVKCYEMGILSKFYLGDYNQYVQEILNKDSDLYKFDPDLIIIFVDIKTLLGEFYFSPYDISDDERRKLIRKKFDEFRQLINTLKDRSSGKIILHNFEIPIYSPLGILEDKQAFGFRESIEFLNDKIRDEYKENAQVFVFDYDAFCSKIGKQNILDYKMYYLADIKINLQHIPDLCDEYLSYIKPLLSVSKKCIVLDLDNTLWGGIIGEDGIEGIKLGPTPEGRPFWEFQKYLLSLFKRGVILAINSKNNYDDVLKVFREHPYMILKEQHFAEMQINWNDKISNMKIIASQINIGLDSLVFIDDDKLNREIVKGSLPEVLVVDLPDDPAEYLEMVMKINDFNTLRITEEDKQKGEMYAQQRQRNEFQKITTDITEYLKGLEMIVTIEKPNKFNIPRISQLTQKTNQFNMTTRRYLEEEIRNFSQRDDFLVVSMKVEDKFGDNGITGVAIVEKTPDTWKINTFLLSCRVIGRKVEETLLAYVVEEAKKANAKKLLGEFIPTKKNAPAKDFYKINGFKLTNKENDTEVWEYNLTKQYNYPDFIKVNKR